MKKTVCILVCLVFLLSALNVVAYASTVYRFELFEPVALYGGDFDFGALPENASAYVYDGILPEGKYQLSALLSLDGVDFRIDSADAFYYPGGNCVVDVEVLSLQDGSVVDRNLISFAFSNLGGFTALVIDFGGTLLNNTMIPLVEFTAVPDLSLSSFLDADMLDGILDAVVALVPVVFGVIVGYIGLRKAIAWLQSVLHGA